jgi:hypothetical protein
MHSPFADNSEMIIAHFSPSEIHELNRLQGGPVIDEKTSLPSFMPLLKMLQHPGVHGNIESLRQYATPKHSEGVAKFIEGSGRFGDSKAAVLPRVVGDIFDHFLNDGKPSINPHTGKREYFLGGLLSGLSNIFNTVTSPIRSVVNSVASPVMNALKPIGGQLLSGVAPMLGGLAQQGISQLGNAAGRQFGMGNIGDQLGSAVGGVVNNMATQAGNTWAGGGNLDPLNTAREGISQLGSAVAPIAQQAASQFAPQLGGMAESALNGAAEGLGLPFPVGAALGGLVNNGVQSLTNWGGEQANKFLGNLGNSEAQPQLSQLPESAARAAIGGMAPTMNDFYGNSPVGAGLSNAMSGYGGGMSPGEAANYGVDQGINQIQNPAAQYLARGGYNTYQNMNNGANAGDAINSGFNSINPELFNNARNYGVRKFNETANQNFNRRAAI